jgi:hypothetical protein
VFSTTPPVDNFGVPPQVWITSPAQNASVPLNEPIHVVANAHDDVAVKSVQIFVSFNGGPPTAVPTSVTSPFTATIHATGEGTLTIIAQATDFGGNVGTSAPVTSNITAPLPVMNFGFESGDLSGWDTSGQTATVVVVNNSNALYAYAPNLSSAGHNIGPASDNYFLAMQSGCAWSPNIVRRVLNLTTGQTISGWAAFIAGDYAPFDDFAVVVLDPGGTEVWRQSVVDVGNYGVSLWTPWSFTAPADDSYTISYESVNSRDCALPSMALFDAPDTL